MQNKWYDKQAAAKIRAIMRQRLIVAGAYVESAAKLNAPVDTGNLRASINSRLIRYDRVRIGTNVFYAPYMEFGTEAKRAKFLTIPIAKEAKGRQARDFPDLFVYRSQNGGLFLAREEGGKLKLMFKLQKRVRARPFLRPALFDNKTAIQRILAG